MTLFHEFLDATTAWADTRQALQHQTCHLTYADVSERSRRVANALHAIGVRRGDRVATFMNNRPEVIEVALACSRIGAVFVPLNALQKSRQLVYALRNCGAKVLVSSSGVVAGAEHSLSECRELERVVACDSTGELSARTLAYEDLAKESGAERPAVCIDNDPAMIMYTSSSTGMPKGVVLSHRNVVSGAKAVATYLGNDKEDRILAALPLSFDYGFSQVTTAFSVGACALLTHYSMAGALVGEVQAERVTGLAGVPTMWAQLAASEWPAGVCATLRYITNSGGVVAPATLRVLQERLPQARIFRMYGLTEAFRSTYLDPKRARAATTFDR